MNARVNGWDEVVALARPLRGVEEGTSYGRPALRVRGRAFAIQGKTPDHFVLSLKDLDRARFLLEMEPGIFFQTPHYVGWPDILLRYGTASPEEVMAWLSEAWAARVPAAWR